MATQPSALSLFPARVPIVDKDGRPSAEFYRALNILFGRVGANGITPGVYGANDKTIVFTIDVYGKVTAIAVLPISITLSQISNLATLTIDANQINDPENIPVTAAQITDPENIPIVAAQITDPANIPIVLAQITDLASLVISYTQVTGLGTMANENMEPALLATLPERQQPSLTGLSQVWSDAVDLLPPEWSVQWVKRYGRPVAFWAVKGNEIHCCRDPLYSGHWLTRQDIERLIMPLLGKYGFLTTAVRSDNQTGHTFVQRLGFVKQHEKDGLVHYRAERINHARL